MAQSALTVTPPNPTPPTNYSCVGATGPIPPNLTKSVYGDPKNWQATMPKDFPPPYYDDGSAGTLTTFATNAAAVAGGTGSAAGGTEGTYPVNGGVVPAGTSAPHEASGSEVVSTAPGSRAECPTASITVFGNYTNNPNASHASSMSPATTPTFASISPATLASAATGTQVITCTGANFVPGCRIWANNVEQTTTFVNGTTLTATVKKNPYPMAVFPIDVRLAGIPLASSRNFVWT